MKIHYDIIYLVFKYLNDYKIMEYKIIVSSFLSNVNNNRPTDIYIEHGKKILYEPNIHVILFIEKKYFINTCPSLTVK